MDWNTFLMAWGPALPIVLVLLKLHRDAIYSIIPKGFKAVLKVQELAEHNAAKRHKEHIKEMKRQARQLKALKRKASLKKKRQAAQGGTPATPVDKPYARK